MGTTAGRLASTLLWAAVSVSSSCGGTNPVQPDVPFRVIGIGGFPGTPVAAPSVRAIRTTSEWARFVADTGLRAPSADPADPLPVINFGSEMAIVIELGARPTSGYQIRVERVGREGSELVAYVTEVPPCVGATVITYPAAAIAVPQTSAPVSAVWQKALPGCR